MLQSAGSPKELDTTQQLNHFSFIFSKILRWFQERVPKRRGPDALVKIQMTKKKKKMFNLARNCRNRN